LRSVVGHGEDSLLINSLHGDSLLDWVEVSSDVLVRVIVVFLNVPSWSIVKDSLLHLKSVGIGVESLVVLEVLNVPFCDNFVSIELNVWKAVNVNLEFDGLLLFIDGNVDDGFHFDILGELIDSFEVEVHL
jgi:hypothetical protein